MEHLSPFVGPKTLNDFDDTRRFDMEAHSAWFRKALPSKKGLDATDSPDSSPSSIPSFSGILSNKRIKAEENLSEKNQKRRAMRNILKVGSKKIEYWWKQ